MKNKRYAYTGRLRLLLDRVLERPVHHDLRPYRAFVTEVNELGYGLRDLTLDELRSRARTLRDMEEAVNQVEAFALIREVADRLIGIRAFDVQLIAALAMHRGMIAEMQTGEGKTLSAIFTGTFNALDGEGVHILTANDYLARRDTEWMRPVYEFFGLDVGCIQAASSPEARRKAYEADVTYATANEAGFDFLRDRLSLSVEEVTQRRLRFAIVDEVDSILIDEAGTPLVIAGGQTPAYEAVRLAADLVNQLNEVHYDLDRYGRSAFLTEEGVTEIERRTGVSNLFETGNEALLTAVNLALQANALMIRDVDYIVRDGRVELVDRFKGRVAHLRRWPYGLHTAVEAKEGLDLTGEGEILSSITHHDFINLYPRKAGMTATAAPSAMEFREFFDLEVLAIPTNRPCIRIDLPDLIFANAQAKESALKDEIVRVHSTGRPVLVGTKSVEESERLASVLAGEAIPCQVLNAKNDEMEAAVIAEAGSLGAVTISTNMAGRGTDIRLGGSDERSMQEVSSLGGLHVVGTNRHDSVRIDMQLRGRSGRQGDPGSSIFFVSLEDELIHKYGARQLIASNRYSANQCSPLDDAWIAKKIVWAQELIDSLNFQIRANLRRYQEVLEEQRQVIHSTREEVLLGEAWDGLDEVRASDRYGELAAKVGVDVVEKAGTQIALFHIDRGWADHLSSMAYIREGIALRSRAGLDPYLEFRKEAMASFKEMMKQITVGIFETFNGVEVSEAGIDLEKEGLRRPSATWSYLLGDTPSTREKYSLLDVARGLVGSRVSRTGDSSKGEP